MTSLLHALFLLFCLLLSLNEGIDGGIKENPATKRYELRMISESREIELGNKHFTRLINKSGGIYKNKSIQNKISYLGKKIANVSQRPELPYEFVVVNSSSKNAWSLPGGKVAIHIGLLKALDTEEEIVSVLAHEIAHINARHGAQALEKGCLYNKSFFSFDVTSSTMLNLEISRQMELEADQLSLNYLKKAGYHPKSALIMQHKLIGASKKASKKKSWYRELFCTHPPKEHRMQCIANALKKCYMD